MNIIEPNEFKPITLGDTVRLNSSNQLMTVNWIVTDEKDNEWLVCVWHDFNSMLQSSSFQRLALRKAVKQ